MIVGIYVGLFNRKLLINLFLSFSFVVIIRHFVLRIMDYMLQIESQQ